MLRVHDGSVLGYKLSTSLEHIICTCFDSTLNATADAVYV
jgi:hypothetical protein